MMVLALDTATPRTEVALLEGQKVLGEFGEPSRNHSVTLLPAIDRLLANLGLGKQHIEAIAVGIGPGSFTGLRVGLAITKSLAYSLEIPLVGVSTLRALACNGMSNSAKRLCPMLDALKREIYCAVYEEVEGQLSEREAEDARDPQQWAQTLAKHPGQILLFGSGIQRYRHVFVDALSDRAVIPDALELHQVKARAIGRLALDRLNKGESDDPHTLEPRYCRLSEAELVRLQR